MKTTLNQIRVELEAIQTAHRQLEDFFWGDFLRATKEESLTYPLMGAYVTGLNQERKLVPTTLVIYVCERYTEAFGTLNDTESDMAQVIRDIYSIMEQSRRWKKLVTIRSAVANKFIERGADVTAGYAMQMQIDIKDATCLASIPLDDYDFDQTLPPATTCSEALIFSSDLVQIGTAPSGGSYTVTDSNVSNSDDSYSVDVKAQASLELPDIEHTDGDGSGVILPAQTPMVCTPFPPCLDATVTLNTDPFLSVASGGSEDITLQDQDSNVITPDSVVGSVVTVTIPTVAVGAKLIKTGQTTSYRTGDDGDLEEGRLTDFYTLASNNPFGNTNRFTDELGGQTYTNDIVIDWSTYDGAEVLGIERVERSGQTWNNSIDNALAVSVGTFTTGWRLPNFNELLNFNNWSMSNGLDYSPINWGAGRKWTSTTNPAGTSGAMTLNGTTISGTGKTSGSRWMPVRNFTNAELGI